MNPLIDLQRLDEAVDAVQSQWPDLNPACGLILGSGWSEVFSEAEQSRLSFSAIPGLGPTAVQGHVGELICTRIGSMDVLIFLGRRHWYEGEGWTPVVLPAYLLHALGAHTLLLTNAAGGIRTDLKPGSLMVIEDHINMLGSNPLIGPHDPRLGSRFPDQTEVYDKTLQQQLLTAGADHTGTYIATSGPTFETPAEIRQYRSMGADAVGMSTVPEAIIANALGMRVAGLSCICNWAAGIGSTRLSHEDVNKTANETLPRMRRTIHSFLEQLARNPV